MVLADCGWYHFPYPQRTRILRLLAQRPYYMRLLLGDLKGNGFLGFSPEQDSQVRCLQEQREKAEEDFHEKAHLGLGV